MYDNIERDRQTRSVPDCFGACSSVPKCRAALGAPPVPGGCRTCSSAPERSEVSWIAQSVRNDMECRRALPSNTERPRVPGVSGSASECPEAAHSEPERNGACQSARSAWTRSRAVQRHAKCIRESRSAGSATERCGGHGAEQNTQNNTERHIVAMRDTEQHRATWSDVPRTEQ